MCREAPIDCDQPEPEAGVIGRRSRGIDSKRAGERLQLPSQRERGETTQDEADDEKAQHQAVFGNGRHTVTTCRGDLLLARPSSAKPKSPCPEPELGPY